MTTLILLDSRLHIPMYFFLSNLSLVWTPVNSSTITPKVMAGLLIGDKTISYYAWSQMFFCSLCHCGKLPVGRNGLWPLRSSVQTPTLHHHLDHRCVCTPGHKLLHLWYFDCCYWCWGHILSLFLYVQCRPSLFCDIPAVMFPLTCSDKDINELIVFLISGFNIFLHFLLFWFPYLLIFITILKLQSGKGYQKAFIHLQSHLVAVSIFYGTVIFMYLQPSSSHSMDTDKVASVSDNMLIPMLNPVYSLRNREVKSAFKKVIVCKVFSRFNPLMEKCTEDFISS